jgi:prolyl oligopeptidase
MNRRLLAVLLGVFPSLSGAQVRPATDTTDPNLFLEEMTGARAMAWVNAENAKTLAVLEKDARFAGIFGAAKAMAAATDRLPGVQYIGGQLYNFWQDEQHVRGLWRRTTLASYRTAKPQWTTVLDLDALAKAEKANWVWKGADCVKPREDRCLLQLSDGGEDAVTVREFDLTTRAFVTNGFALPKGKQRVSWAGRDTLLFAAAFTPAELTASGYPYIVRRVARGQAISQATEVMRGAASDGGYGISPYTLVDAAGRRASFVVRPLNTFDFEHYLLRGGQAVKLAVPAKASIVEMIDGLALVRLSQAWTSGSTTIPAGAVAAFSLTTAGSTPDQLNPTVVYAPGARESVEGVNVTGGRVLLDVLQNVRGRVLSLARNGTTWTPTRLPLPDNVTAGVVSVEAATGAALITVTGYLTPTSIWQANAVRGTAQVVKSLAPRFDASQMVVEQREATSTDGVKIPYFMIAPKGLALDGSNPTILEAYGGFEVSMTPSYDQNAGKLWVSQGGVYVVANIRGGGEFGPAWHEAGLKTKRQIIYDDFRSVAEDLIARKVTSPKRLGIVGGSNGGLLMGVQFTQHPELWNAVSIEVPLLDMLRFEQIQAGASWVGEYGSVSVPEERAFLAKISPYHNLKAGVKYPTPLIWTTTKDDRVGPQHARKFAAKMHAMGLPYYFYEVTEGGHGAGANIEQRAKTTALEYTYFAKQLMDAKKAFVP